MEQVPDFQRVLILQGGGSLGAYEAGAYMQYMNLLPKGIRKKGLKVNQL